jgi:hypothetical protein
MKIFIICIFVFVIHACSFGQPTVGKYANFTPERQAVLEKMGEFFDKTIRENFPAKTDSSSYKAFFYCIFNKAGYESQNILQIDRKRLAEINAELFKEENYYFFYARYFTIQANDTLEMLPNSDHLDSIPTMRVYVSDIRRMEGMWWWYIFPYNPFPGGYMQQVVKLHSDNPVIYRAGDDMRASGGFSITLLGGNIQNNFQEISNPIVKQLAAVVFWRYICFCGGVDMVNRKRFCDECSD